MKSHVTPVSLLAKRIKCSTKTQYTNCIMLLHLMLEALRPQNLKYCFKIKVCVSIHPSVHLCVRILVLIPPGKSENVTNKKCYICLRGEKNALKVTP